MTNESISIGALFFAVLIALLSTQSAISGLPMLAYGLSIVAGVSALVGIVFALFVEMDDGCE